MQVPQSHSPSAESTGAEPPAAEAAGHPAPSTPRSWRFGIAVAILALALATYASQQTIGPRGQSLAGVLFFFGLVAMFSANLRAVNWRTIGCGILLQMGLALLVLHGRITIGEHQYSVYHAIERAGDVVTALIDCSDQGAKFVFGNLADPASMHKVFGQDYLFAFAFKALPPILFLSALFTVLYHFGVLQACVRLAARVMEHLMHTSGAETLSVAANVFMGQTEAPLIVRPYVPRMTNSELFAVMTSGMAHISGGLMAVYISYGANPVAVLTTCIMACPCSLYLSKLFLPELGRPETIGVKAEHSKSPYVNAVDAAAAGTTDGLQLALNVAAMLIVFIAFVALFDAALAWIRPEWFGWTGLDLPPQFSLHWIFGKLFSPVAMLIGVEAADQSKVGTLLGYKLSINEHVAYLTMQSWTRQPDFMSPRSYHLAAYALTGFANFASVGIQLGGIGAMAPSRRHDLARLGMKALFVGFVATLLNASIAGFFSPLSG
ncbi:MAG TPA: nucleoside transporter C-terminal domain-containing protein [Pirellulales bacterium]|jgi:CNT family concentrative nucleoside transporter|nr:nucleoside transporter C-terminal domain-containing protein [Pirellulales bacterium]